MPSANSLQLYYLDTENDLKKRRAATGPHKSHNSLDWALVNPNSVINVAVLSRARTPLSASRRHGNATSYSTFSRQAPRKGSRLNFETAQGLRVKGPSVHRFTMSGHSLSGKFHN